MTEPLGLDQIGQLSLLTRDAIASERFYREVLGLRHLYTFGDLVFFDCDGVRLFIREVHDPEAWRASSTIYFRVADIQRGYGELLAHGVTIREAPELIHRHDDGVEEWMTFFDDPDGNLLALMAQVRG